MFFKGDIMANKKLTVIPPNRRDPAREFLQHETPNTSKNLDDKILSHKNTKEEKRKPGRPTKDVKKKQYTLALYPDLYDQICEFAKDKGHSFNQVMAHAAIEYIKNQQ